MAGGQFAETKAGKFTARDFRFTARGKTLYAIALGWPQGQWLVRSLAGEARVARVDLLGGGGPLQFSNTPEGLAVTAPSRKPCEHAFALKVTLT